MAGQPDAPASSTAPLLPLAFPSAPIPTAIRVLQPVALCGIYYLSFGSLVAAPTDVLAKLLVVTAATQVVYLVGAVPEVSDKYKGRRRPGEKRGVLGKGTTLGRDLFTATLSLFLTALITPFLHLTLVLFGAPLLSQPLATLLCAAHIALLTIYPLFFAHGVEGRPWYALGSLSHPIDEVYGGMLGGLFGAWLGAVPIPLDWDREWQKWPVTVVTGAYLGVVFGRALGATVGWGKRAVELDLGEKKTE